LDATIARALGANEDLVEAICLAHDLGHSPFGHAGEYTLAKLMKDFGGFDHNKQSLRIVTELEQRYPEFPRPEPEPGKYARAWSKHESEYDITDARAFDPELRGNLETQICNVADELAYTTHDLDDGLRSGMITPQMLEGIALWEILVQTFNWHGPLLQDMDRHRMIRQLVGLMVNKIWFRPQTPVLRKARQGPPWISRNYLIMSSVTARICQRRNREIKDFLYKKLYRHYRVVRMQSKG